MANKKLLIDLQSVNMEEVDTSECTDVEGILSAVITYLSELPTVDAVEVVRCGNCKHFCEPFCCRRDDETHRERINMLTVDFCSYGEMRINE